MVSALAAVVAGRAAARFGNSTVLVAGLAVLAVSLLVRLFFRIDTPVLVVGAVIALTTLGGAILQTPQTTVMMSSAPTNLGGVVSAVKASVGGTFYGFGAALFSIAGIILFVRKSGAKLAEAGISIEQVGEVLRTTTVSGKPASPILDPQRTALVLSEAASGTLDAARVLNLTMTLIPLTAIIIVLVLFRRGRVTAGDYQDSADSGESADG